MNLNSAKSDPKDKLRALLGQLEGINQELLQNLAKRQSQDIAARMQERTQISDQINKLCTDPLYAKVTLDAQIKQIAEQVLQQDQQLLSFLELEVQKLQGKKQALSYLQRRSFH